MTGRALPSLKALRAYEAFARAGSMTRAAEELHVTHGAVSRQIKALETELGVRLVSGPRHRLALTPAGQTLAAALASGFDLIAVALPGAERTEELVVSCLGTFAMKWLIPRLPGFLDAHSGLSVRILESHGPVDFGDGGFHAAIRVEGVTIAPGTRATPFMAHFHGPVLSPALFEAAGRDADAVLRLPRLNSETFRPGWTRWAKAAGLDLPEPDLEREFEHNSYMLEAAVAGLGVAVAPWAFAESDIERGRLVAPWGFEPVGDRFVYLRPGLTDNPAAAAFGDWLRQEGRRSPGPPEPLFSGSRHGSG
jgi:LysR family glycine cleavage system transcriptional activator